MGEESMRCFTCLIVLTAPAAFFRSIIQLTAEVTFNIWLAQRHLTVHQADCAPPFSTLGGPWRMNVLGVREGVCPFVPIDGVVSPLLDFYYLCDPVFEFTGFWCDDFAFVPVRDVVIYSAVVCYCWIKCFLFCFFLLCPCVYSCWLIFTFLGVLFTFWWMIFLFLLCLFCHMICTVFNRWCCVCVTILSFGCTGSWQSFVYGFIAVLMWCFLMTCWIGSVIRIYGMVLMSLGLSTSFGIVFFFFVLPLLFFVLYLFFCFVYCPFGILTECKCKLYVFFLLQSVFFFSYGCSSFIQCSVNWTLRVCVL